MGPPLHRGVHDQAAPRARRRADRARAGRVLHSSLARPPRRCAPRRGLSLFCSRPRPDPRSGPLHVHVEWEAHSSPTLDRSLPRPPDAHASRRRDPPRTTRRPPVHAPRLTIACESARAPSGQPATGSTRRAHRAIALRHSVESRSGDRHVVAGRSRGCIRKRRFAPASREVFQIALERYELIQSYGRARGEQRQSSGGSARSASA